MAMPRPVMVGHAGVFEALKNTPRFRYWYIQPSGYASGLHFFGHASASPPSNPSLSSPWGNVCPARARRATFVLTIPTSAPDLPSHGEAPQVDHIALHTFPTKHVAK